MSFFPQKNPQIRKSKFCSQRFLSIVKTHLLRQTRIKSDKNWRRNSWFSIFIPPPLWGPPSQNIFDFQNLMIKNKIPHLGAPYATNGSKIGWKLAELLRFRLSQDVTRRRTSGTHTVREVRPGLQLGLDMSLRFGMRFGFGRPKNYLVPNFIKIG